MKYLHLTLLLVFLPFVSHAQDIFELEPSQSMLMTGKGPGQDAVINPYPNQDCIAIIDNIGEKEFSIRVQAEGKIIEMIPVQPKTTKKVKLPKGYELYLDTDYITRARVKIEKNETEPKKTETQYISITLKNNSAKSIPLIIPSVMNPNLSPFSNSGVTLKIGQDIYFREKSKKYLLLTVNESIQNDSIINVSKILKERKKVLGL